MASIDLKKLFKRTENTDGNIYMALLKAFKDKHQDGFDYLRFKQSVHNLKAMNIDEDTSIKSAYATASTLGVTKTKLINSVKYYKTILTKERESFAEAMRNQLKNKVEAKKIEAEKLAQKISEYKIKISKMKQEMNAYQQKIDSVDEEMESARSKIEETRDKFEATFSGIDEIIEADISKLSTLI